MTSTVYVAVTTRDGNPKPAVRAAIERATNTAQAAGIRCLVATHTNGYGVTLCRNAAVAKFLVSKCSHLLFVDDDVILPADAIVKLTAAEQSVVLGCYAGTKDAGNGRTWIYVVILRLGGTTDDCYLTWPDGLVEVAAGGAGCMLIRRDVFEAIPYPWFRWQGTYIAPAGQIVTIGEDIDFCQRARGAGHRVYADGSVRCGHLKEINISELIRETA